MDITVRLGYPFRNMVHYTIGEKNEDKKTKVNHDLYVSSKEFKIEVKYLKNWDCSTGTKSNKKQWSEYEKDFTWLFSEIDADYKNKRAFVIGWFNCTESFTQLIQLGASSGRYPLINEEKLRYFPFLKSTNKPTRTRDIRYDYDLAYQQLTLDFSRKYNCIFLGCEKDKFHFAIYY